MNGLRERRGKKFRKNPRLGPGKACAIFESKKFWCDAPPLLHLSPSPPPSFRENGEKVSRSLERTEADIDYYTPSRIETRLETFRAQPRF